MARRGRLALAAALMVGALLLAPAPGAAATVPELDWQPCEGGFECATAQLPLDHRRPDGRTIGVAMIRRPATDPATRIGSLFVNPGGPGASAVDFVRATATGEPGSLFETLNDRFDIVGFDPRGAGATQGALDCEVNQETLGVYAQPFVTPFNVDTFDWVGRAREYVRACLERNDVRLWSYATTANVARDMDLLRRAVGDEKLSYLGFSYGTFLGATYSSLFGDRARALVLDGALDATGYINRPLRNLREQTAGFEKALARFFEACAADQAACVGFGGADPWVAYDELLERMNASPLPAPEADDPRPVDGEDLIIASFLVVYAKQNWPLMATMLAQAAQGDGSLVRVLVNAFYEREEDGTYGPGLDRYYGLGAIEQRYPSDVETFAEAGRHSWLMFDHFWSNSGYVELPWGLLPIKPRGAYFGPFRTASSAPTTLVVGTTYDPATPYRGSQILVKELGNARLLTMRGDGHTAYGDNSECIDAAVDAYLEEGTVPAEGRTCRQEVPFAQPTTAEQRLSPAAAERLAERLAPHRKPILD